MNSERKKPCLYPNLASRILLYLRSVYYIQKFVYPQELIRYFQTSKSFISQKLKILKEFSLIHTEKISNPIHSAPHLKIFITKKGLKSALKVLSEGLTDSELDFVKSQGNK